MRKATNIARENLMRVGTCIGEFTKTRRFRLHITALDFMAPYAKVMVTPVVTIRSYIVVINMSVGLQMIPWSSGEYIILS